jgi:hypothetical protein
LSDFRDLTGASYRPPPEPPPYPSNDGPSKAEAFFSTFLAGVLVVAFAVATTFFVAVTGWLCVWVWEVVW